MNNLFNLEKNSVLLVIEPKECHSSNHAALLVKDVNQTKKSFSVGSAVLFVQCQLHNGIRFDKKEEQGLKISVKTDMVTTNSKGMLFIQGNLSIH